MADGGAKFRNCREEISVSPGRGHAQPTLWIAVLRAERLGHGGDLGELTAEDEELALSDGGVPLELPRLAHAGAKVLAHGFEQEFKG